MRRRAFTLTEAKTDPPRIVPIKDRSLQNLLQCPRWTAVHGFRVGPSLHRRKADDPATSMVDYCTGVPISRQEGCSVRTDKAFQMCLGGGQAPGKVERRGKLQPFSGVIYAASPCRRKDFQKMVVGVHDAALGQPPPG